MTRQATLRDRETEREGFEPSIEREPDTRLAGECLQPLGHLSGRMPDCMGRFLAGMVVTLVLLAVGAQLALPRYLEGRVEQRLEEEGGRAEVSLSALPALALLGGSGDAIEVGGTRLAFDLDDPREDPFERLDGFDRVEVDLDDSQAGPVAIEEFVLERGNGDPGYELSMRATTTPRELARDLGSRAGGALGGLLGSFATGAFPEGGRVAVPLELDASIVSDGGRTEVLEASGSVAGIPAGPLTELVVGAVLDRL